MQQEQDTINTALGVISYLRCLFSEDSFETKSVNGLDLKLLRSTPETTRMVQWIQSLGAYREKIYKISIGIYSLAEDRLVEVYSIRPGDSLDVKGVCRCLQKMELLRGKYAIKLKVFTTSFIEIQGFKRSAEIWELGELKEVEYEGIKIYRAVNGGDSQTIGPTTGQVNNQTAGQTANIALNQPLNQANQPLNQVNRENTINCPCLINSNENEMIQCIKCLNWVHASCHGYFSSKDRRIKRDFTCYQCNGIVSRELKDCCVYRRVLTVLYNEEAGSASRIEFEMALARKFGFSRTFMGSLVGKLRGDGFIRIGKGGVVEIVKNGEIKEKIKGYFNGRKMESLIAMEDIKCEISQ